MPRRRGTDRHAATVSDATLVGAILTVQRLVSGGAPPTDTYHAVIDGALALLDADSGSLRFVDLEDPSWMVAVATRGSAGAGERWRQRSPVTEGVSGRVIRTGQLTAIDDYEHAKARSQLAPLGVRAIIGVALRERDRVVGSLVVGTKIAGRGWTERQRELLSAYAEHIGLTLSLARAGYAVAQAFTDSLTGLGNRALLLDRLEHELVRSDRGGGPVTVLFLDLDRFKLVNDSLGHSAGDQLLVAVAARMRQCVRDSDVCARLGGDEFAVLLTGPGDPAAAAQRIIDALQRRFQIGDHEVFVSASIGIATGSEEGSTLLRNADVAMYHAKRGGAGRFEHFEPSMHAALVSRLDLDAELRRAIERDELELHYQPIVDLRSGEVAAFEALLRWRHPERGLVRPGEFLPVALETGLIDEIGRWALQQACSQFATWWRKAPVAINVNVSARELQRPDYAATLEQLIGGAFPPSALILDVAESTPFEQAAGALESLAAVSKLGVRIAIDDFGAGYSSLLNLAHLPVHMLKMAKPFVAALGDGPHAQRLVAGILGVGRELGLPMVAQGIEQPRQRALLSGLGCELGQGYLLGPPLDPARAGALLTG